MNDLITNGTEIKQRIISEINNAKQCIYLAMAYFTDREIAMSIIDAKNRNVAIDIILSSNAQNETVKLMLKGANIGVHAFETGDARGIMHHKFCLIDNRISINGSYNYSINASTNNVENIQVSDDLGMYSQFLTEYERLKYKIDNRIAVNETMPVTENKSQPLKPTNIVDTFSEHLHNLVYSATQIDTAKYKEDGYENSKANEGNIDIFRTEYKTIKEKIKTYATDEGLGSMKNILISNITNSYQSTKTGLESEKQEKINVEKRANDLDTKQTNDKILELKKEKSIFESGDSNTGEKGLLQINKEIEINKLERRTLEQSFIVKKFWTIGSIFTLVGIIFFSFYLSLFFASAIYKVFFEGNLIKRALEEGITPALPQLVDANAILKIFKSQGALFGLFAAFFFVIPILLSNLKILGSKNKLINNLLFWVGLLIFDILVSTMVAINTDEIKSLLAGRESTIKLWEVIKHGEFWLIFVFGMFPLILMHFFVDYIHNNYKNSQRDIVDAERNRRIKILELDMLELSAHKELLLNKVREKDEIIDENNKRIINLQTEINKIQTALENNYNEMQRQIKVIFDDFSARITSGKIFTDVILDSVISAYKSGFIEFLPQFYSAEEVAKRVAEIDQATSI